MSAKLSIDEMQKLARDRGAECLSRSYENLETKIKWRCSEGHEWEAFFARIFTLQNSKETQHGKTNRCMRM